MGSSNILESVPVVTVKAVPVSVSLAFSSVPFGFSVAG